MIKWIKEIQDLLVFIVEQKHSVIIKEFFNLAMTQRQLYNNLKTFWTKTFFERKKNKLYILVWEVPVLVMGSFLTFLRRWPINFQFVFLIVLFLGYILI